MAGLPCAWGRGSGTGWLTFSEATHRARRQRPGPRAGAVQSSLLADGVVALSVPTQRALYVCQESSSY